MTVLEEYKADVDNLIDRLNSMCINFDDKTNAIKLMSESSAKLQDMMDIVINTGIANGAMAEMFKIMCK
jgi:uncharacterized protein YajQ (UPF0234 family)